MDYIVREISIKADERGCSDLEAAPFGLPVLTRVRGRGSSLRVSLAAGGAVEIQRFLKTVCRY
jgi:hypothetical protein